MSYAELWEITVFAEKKKFSNQVQREKDVPLLTVSNSFQPLVIRVQVYMEERKEGDGRRCGL